MKKGYLHLLLAILFCLTAFIPASQLQAQSWTGKQTSINANVGGFYEYLPVGYDGVKKFPVIVFLHGMGELGNGKSDLVNITVTGLPRLINTGAFPTTFSSGGNNFSFIVICPQFQNWPSANDVDAVISYALANYSVDLSRVYLTGLSMGGGATWDHTGSSVSRASRLAAVVPICGASTPNSSAILNMTSASIPVLATHNADDPIVTLSNTTGYVDGLNAQGISPSAVKIIWPSGGHDAWTKTYNPANKIVNGTMNVYEWMLQYKRGSSTPPPPPPPPTSPLTASISGSTNPTCYSHTNGSATATASGGTAPYTYSWSTSPAQTGATASNLGAGSYTVTVKDANGNTATASVTLTQPEALAISVTPGVITIAGGTTSVSLSATGGTAPYTFTGPTSNVSAGTYTYRVTDGKGCGDSKTITITEPAPTGGTPPPPPPPPPPTPPVINSVASRNVTCNGGSNGEASVSVVGGTAPYTYTWNTSPVQTSSTATGLKAGSYTVTVKDAAGLSSAATVSVGEPQPLSLQVGGTMIQKIGGTTVVALQGVGGTSPYTYTGNTAGLRPGNYSYQVKDANGCTSVSSAEVKEPGIKLSSLTLSTADTIIKLNWSTSYEYAIDRFEVEKAKDDKSFFNVGMNKSKGSGQNTLAYTQPDASQVSGSNTYRLYAVTSFGEKVYLGEKKIFFNELGSVQIRNMINTVDITITSSREEKVTIQLFDMLGRPVSQTVVNKSALVYRTLVPMSGLQNGMYVVKVATASGMQSVKQVVKQ